MHFRADHAFWRLMNFRTDAAGTLAAELFLDVEGLDPDGVSCVLGRMMRRERLRPRRDGVWLCVDLADGSVLMLSLDIGRVDRLGVAWPWLMALPDRWSAEVLLEQGTAIEPEFSLGVVLVDQGVGCLDAA